MLMTVQTPQQLTVVFPSQAIKPSILILLLAPQMKKELTSQMDQTHSQLMATLRPPPALKMLLWESVLIASMLKIISLT